MLENTSVSWRQPRVIIFLVGLILLAGIIFTAIIRDRLVSTVYRQVTVNGQGKVAYNPDLAIVTLGVQIDKVSKPEEALNQLNAKVTNILKEIKTLGISDEDIQTQSYYLSPQYDYINNANTVTGYNANQQITVKVSAYDEDQNKLNTVIGAASKAGVNQILGLSFEASNINELKQQARILAIQDAKIKSASLAEAAGVKIKNIVSWWENMVSPMPYSSYDYGKGGMGASGAVSPQTSSGGREVIVEVGVTFNIK
jgi:hypothetical protein